MSKKRALITGITGQDGHHLAKLLLSKDYEIHGLVLIDPDDKYHSFTSLFPSITLHVGDLRKSESLKIIIDTVKPHEIYHLGAITFVAQSFVTPELVADITGLGTLRLLEVLRQSEQKLSAKVYIASSSEMFGQVLESPQTEKTPFYPRSPYGVAKTFSHFTAVNYRQAYGMHISTGILFNHEGEYRGYEFVTRKITSNIARIALGLQKKFSLGSLTPCRDWGYAGDYVEAMWLMLQEEVPDDYVIATGRTHSVADFVKESLMVAGLKGELEDYVIFDENFTRPSEVNYLLGDASKARLKLGWQPKVDFEGLVELMVKNDLEIEKRHMNKKLN